MGASQNHAAMCQACREFDAAERAAIEGRDLPEHALDGCQCNEREIDVLFIEPQAFRRKPQRGTPYRMSWELLEGYLSRPTLGVAKNVAGAISPALYVDDVRRRDHVLRVWAIVLDFDDGGRVDDVTAALAAYRAIVHETFTSTANASRCRAYLELAQPIDVADYERLHRIVREHFRAVGLAADEAAKDASRCSYVPVRRADSGYAFRVTHGSPLDAERVLRAHGRDVSGLSSRAAQKFPEKRTPREILRRAEEDVRGAPAGARHVTLCRTAFRLSVLEVDDAEIEATLLPAFVSVVGDDRRTEGRRAIRDAIAAQRRSPCR